MDYAQISLILGQIVVFVANAIIYGRQKSAVDIEKRDRGAFGVTVADALRHAQEAERIGRELRLDNYELLRQKFEAQELEISQLKAKVIALEESIASLSNKLASRDRADRHAARREAAEAQALTHTASEPQTLEDYVRMGVAVPLSQSNPQAPPPANNVRPGNFGRTAKGG